MANVPVNVRVTVPSLTNAQLVRNWTEESSGRELPKQPRLMGKEEVAFIVKMVFSELAELCETVVDQDTVPKFIAECFSNAVYEWSSRTVSPAERETRRIADQADALVDVMYYMYNAAAKAGVDLDSVFQVVHRANEAKRWPDGTYHRREDGKVIKPPGWQEPNIEAEIIAQGIAQEGTAQEGTAQSRIPSNP